MAVIVIGIEVHQDTAEAVDLVTCAAKKIVAPDAEPPEPIGVGVLTWTTAIAPTHPEAQDAADVVLDECADQIGIARRNELVTVVR